MGISEVNYGLQNLRKFIKTSGHDTLLLIVLIRSRSFGLGNVKVFVSPTLHLNLQFLGSWFFIKIKELRLNYIAFPLSMDVVWFTTKKK
jgi:hypothetical protein